MKRYGTGIFPKFKEQLQLHHFVAITTHFLQLIYEKFPAEEPSFYPFYATFFRQHQRF